MMEWKGDNIIFLVEDLIKLVNNLSLSRINLFLSAVKKGDKMITLRRGGLFVPFMRVKKSIDANQIGLGYNLLNAGGDVVAILPIFSFDFDGEKLTKELLMEGMHRSLSDTMCEIK